MVYLRYPAILTQKIAGVVRADAELLELRPNREPRGPFFDQKCRHAASSVRSDESRQHHRGVTRLRLRDENFLSIQDPLVGLPIESRGGPNTRRVRAGAGLRNRDRYRVVLPLLVLLGSRDRLEHRVAKPPFAPMQPEAAPVSFQHDQ